MGAGQTLFSRRDSLLDFRQGPSYRGAPFYLYLGFNFFVEAGNQSMMDLFTKDAFLPWAFYPGQIQENL